MAKVGVSASYKLISHMRICLEKSRNSSGLETFQMKSFKNYANFLSTSLLLTYLF